MNYMECINQVHESQTCSGVNLFVDVYFAPVETSKHV